MSDSLLSLFGAWGVAIIFVIAGILYLRKEKERVDKKYEELVLLQRQELKDAFEKHRTELVAKEAELRAAYDARLKDALEHTAASRDAMHLVETVVTLIQEMRAETKDEPEFRRRVEALLSEIRSDTERLTLSHSQLEVLINDAKRKRPGSAASGEG